MRARVGVGRDPLERLCGTGDDFEGGGKRTLSCSVPKILARYEAILKS